MEQAYLICHDGFINNKPLKIFQDVQKVKECISTFSKK